MTAANNYPTKSYTDQELQNIRKWEQKWTPKKITAKNAEQVKELLPDSFYNLIKNTEIWGESWFTIVPYKQIIPSPENITATKKYLGSAKIVTKGEIVNWTAGVPFPDPKNGIQIAHNFRRQKLW